MAVNLDRWSNEQGQNNPYQGDRSFYDLEAGGSADRTLPVLVSCVARNDEQGRAAIDRVMQVHAATGVNTIRICNLEDNHNATWDHTNLLQRELAASQAEVRELRERKMTEKRRMFEVEHKLAKSRARSSRK